VNTESGRMKGFFGGLFLTIVSGLLLVGAAWWLLTILGEYPIILLVLSGLSLLVILLYVGFVFFGFPHREQTQDVAEQAIAEATAASGATEAGPWATFDLGLKFDAQGEYDRAVEAYQHAIDSGHSEAAPRAAFNLGLMSKEQGEYEQAVEAYQQAIDSGHSEWASKAVFNLGMLFEERGDYDLAEEAYQQAIDSEHPGAASKARLNLGVLFEHRGEYDQAEEAYQQAIDSGHPETVAKGRRNLEWLPMRENARVRHHPRNPPPP
jgi:tetratricopeptide (TPR) repeat protein